VEKAATQDSVKVSAAASTLFNTDGEYVRLSPFLAPFECLCSSGIE
jgi:hypothetical protein